MIGAGKPQFVLDQRALDQLLNSPSGPMARHLARIGGRIEGEVRANLSGRPLSNGLAVNVDTGRLRSSASWRLFTRGQRLGLAVGVGARYGGYLSQGTSRGLVARPFLEDAARAVLGPSVI